MDITPGQLLQMAEYSYQDNAQPPENSNLEVLGVFTTSGEDHDVGYYGVAYRIKGQADSPIIIAHRGTEPTDVGLENPRPGEFIYDGKHGFNWKDMGTDAGIAGSQLQSGAHIGQPPLPEQFALGDQFTQMMKEKYPDATFIQTGHSLGGGIAQYAAAHHHQQSVAFDPPATSHIINTYVPDANPDDATVFKVNDSLVSTELIVDQFGKVKMVYPRPPHETGMLSTLTFADHGTGRIKSCFDEQGNLVSDKPGYWDALVKAEWEKNEVVVRQGKIHGELIDEIRTKEYFNNNFEEYKASYLKSHNITETPSTSGSALNALNTATPDLKSTILEISKKAMGLSQTVK